MARMRVLLSEIDPVSVGDVVYPPGGRLGPRWQRDVQLVLVHEGSARIAVDGAERALLRAGAAGLLLPGHREEFWFAADAPTRHSWVQGRLADGHASRLGALPASLPASTALTELVREAVAVSRTPLPTARPLLAALASAALWRYAGEAESRVRGPGEAVDRARSFLHDHLADPAVDLEQVARFAHVSPAHLVRRFRAELGVTPIAYLWERRVATGVDLLANTGLPVGEIAARTGFKSVYHFSRRVKEHTGASPTRVRRASWISPRKG
jgi:AraC-like DNA-binding protein